MIKLYETNAGNLTITVGVGGYTGLEHTDSTFRVDAELLEDCHPAVDDWTLDEIDLTTIDPADFEDTIGELVAIYDNGKVEIVAKPGIAASRYLVLESDV